MKNDLLFIFVAKTKKNLAPDSGVLPSEAVAERTARFFSSFQDDKISLDFPARPAGGFGSFFINGKKNI